MAKAKVQTKLPEAPLETTVQLASSIPSTQKKKKQGRSDKPKKGTNSNQPGESITSIAE